MFPELSRKFIEDAIIDLSATKNLKNTKYRVWYKRKLLPPKDVIRRAYELISIPNPNPDFTTDNAQKKLIDLGFPIIDVDYSGKNDFFSQKELISFKKLIELDYYDQNNTVDQNIGQFLHDIVWEKTKLWANKLQFLGWQIKGKKSWNEQRNNIIGQGFKPYTWYKIYPKNYTQELIYFTIGVHSDGSLLYKMDIHRNDPFFSKDIVQFFDKKREELKAGWQVVPLRDVPNFNWDKLVTLSHNFFLKQTDNYFSLTNEIWKDRRLMRLTWNTNNWEYPIRHKWKKEKQGNTNVAYENQYGYGHEEWLFNPRYRLDGYQYGYIRGIDSLSGKDESIDEIILYTIDTLSKNRYLVGVLKDVEIIEGYEEELRKFKPVYLKYRDSMIAELVEIEADYKHFISFGLLPNIRFKWKDMYLYKELIPVPFLHSNKFNRFQPYKVEGEFYKTIQAKASIETSLKFKSGKASTTDKYQKRTKEKQTTVKRLHSKITNDLYDYFNTIKGYSEDQLSAEMTKVGAATVDFVLKEDDVLSLFEVKTSVIGLINIREALGQLFEYAFLDQSVKIKKLYIVGSAELKKHELKYLRKIKSMFKIPIDYWAYMTDIKVLHEKFKKQ